MCTGLLIIDVQNDYFSGGKLPLQKTEATLANIVKLKEEFEVNQLPVFLIQHIKENQTDFFEKNTTGAEIHKALYPLGTKNHLVIKNYPNSFFKTDLQDKLRHEKVDRLVIVGMMTHMCVDSTTRAASERGY